MDCHDIFLVFVDGAPGHQEEYAQWFAGVHMADMLRLPGVLSASAFRLEALDGKPVPAGLCAIYETLDGPGILATIAAAKGTEALPVSDIQGRMIWRVLEGQRSRAFAGASEPVVELICMFAGPRDEATEDRIWQMLCDDPQGIAAIRQTRLSPAQPSRGSEYSGILFIGLAASADPARLGERLIAALPHPDSRILVAHPMENHSGKAA